MKKDFTKEIENLDEVSYKVTQNSGTERPFTSPLNEEYGEGI